ncbi:MAG: hypothetical protein Q4G33_05005 [bacterium]|nr:hypothetical protein [bacterium]
MNKKVTKKLLIGALICCNLLSNMAFATDQTARDVYSYPVINVTDNEGITPYTMYFVSSNITIYRALKTAEIYVNTEASRKIDHIYQDITIYKNHNWVSSERYHKYNTQELLTTISVSAQTGDYIEVYVDHYTEHQGTVETRHKSQVITF